MPEEQAKAILYSIGLNHTEIEIYIDLIKSGKSTVVDISKRVKIHRPNIYDSLERLIEKGLASKIIEEKHNLFSANDPKNLIFFHNQKQQDIKDVTKLLEKIQNKEESKREVSVVEGVSSIRNILTGFIETGKPISVYGTPDGIIDILGEGFMKDFHKQRVKKKIPLKHIYNKNASAKIKALNKLEYSEARYLPSRYESQISTNICGNTVVLMFWEEPISAVIIKSSAIAKSYKDYFRALWENAIKKSQNPSGFTPH